MGGEEKVMQKTLLELRPGDVIVDPVGERHIVAEPVEMGVDEDGDLGWKVYTDTYPRGGVMDGRLIVPVHGPDSILFNVEVV